jgi:hypothetical protein
MSFSEVGKSVAAGQVTGDGSQVTGLQMHWDTTQVSPGVRFGDITSLSAFSLVTAA